MANRVSTHKKIGLIFLAAVFLATAGCAKKTDITPQQPEMGILNMAKAVKEHPRYNDVQKLQSERNTLANQLLQEEAMAVSANQQAGLTMANLQKASDQEFQTKMAGKQDDLNHQLKAKSESFRQEINQRIDAYVKELDTSYQHRIFALQVKLKTIDLPKEEQENLQKQMTGIQEERMGKIVDRQQELTDEMSGKMKEAESEAAKQLNEYSGQLRADLAAELSKQAQSMKTPPARRAGAASVGSQRQTEIAAKDQEIAKLQQEIISDIKQCAADIAIQQGLSTVLADVEIFTSATRDITADVIAGSKK